jgi:hypothetical protein
MKKTLPLRGFVVLVCLALHQGFWAVAGPAGYGPTAWVEGRDDMNKAIAQGNFDWFLRLWSTHEKLRTVASYQILCDACAWAQPQIVEFLLARGIKPGTDSDGKSTAGHYTPLHAVCSSLYAKPNQDNDRILIVKMLLKSGANVNGRDEEGATPLHYLCFRGGGENLEMARFLIKNGANVNAQDNDKITPLATAVAAEKKALEAYLRGVKGKF